MMERIVKKTRTDGSECYIIQHRFLWWWETISIDSFSWHGEYGGIQNLEFSTIEEAEMFTKKETFQVVKRTQQPPN